MIGRLLAGASALALLAGCGLDDSNFSQYPGFDGYLQAEPRSEQPASARERALLEHYRPRFYVADDEPGPIGFYGDYIAEGHLETAAGERVSREVDRDLLNAHQDDPAAVFTHTGEADGGDAVVPARAETRAIALPGMAEPVKAVFLKWNLVFRQSGIATGIPGWQRLLLDVVGDTDDWHQLDHYAAVTLVLVPSTGVAVADAGPADLIPLAVMVQQHNYLRTYVLTRDRAAAHPGRLQWPSDERIAIDVAEGSHALFPHAPEARRHRAVRFLDPDTARYLITGENAPWLAGDDRTAPEREVDYELTFLPPADAFYMFEGWLGERRRLPGRDAPPGAFYNTLPALKPAHVRLPVFFWHEEATDYPGDFAELDVSGPQPPAAEALEPFQRRFLEALPCRDDWSLPCR